MSSPKSPSTPKIDKHAFIKYMKKIGRAYRKQAKELVSISRLFVQAQNQTFGSNANRSLEIVLQAVDDALKSAAEEEKKTSNGADKAFKNAVDMLKGYGRDYHPEEAVAKRMEKAEEDDKSSLKVLNKLKETFRPLEEEPTTEVEFFLLESLPDKNPTVVTQVLGKNSKLSEVLWNFSRYKGNKRLTLKQNPHFYRDLPGKYEEDFQSDPIEQFLDALGDSKGYSPDRDVPKPKISVLTDRQGRIYLESEQGSRAFGNVWCPQKAIIFKDVCGKLEGEKIVGLSIKSQSNLQYCEEPSPTSTNTMEWKPLQDWTEPIRRLLRSQSPDRDVSNIHIGMEQSSPHKSRKISPFISNTKRTGSSNTPPLSQPQPQQSIQPQPVVTAGISSKHGTAQSPLSSAPTQHQPAVTAGVLSNHKIAQPPPPSSASTQPLPAASNHGPPQASRPLLPISSPPNRTTPAPVPLTKPIPPSQHYQTPPNVAQERQSQACAFTKETLNISLKVDVASPFTQNVTITSHKSCDGGSRNASSHAAAELLGSKLEGPTSKDPKPDVTPPPLQTQPQKPAQRRVWQVWFQSIWTSEK